MISFLVASLLFAADPVQPRVNITSQPAGATVIVDGQDRGTTPITLFDIEPGRHHLKYRLMGYVEKDRFFNTNEGPFIERNEVLVEEKGILLLQSEPSDCNIQIDGIDAGRTPRLITHLSSKDAYTIKLSKPGYQDQTLLVKFNGRKPLVRKEKLMLASGILNISSEPAGAEVMVNGIVRGNTPIRVEGVPKGRAIVKFRLNGFADEVRDLAVNAGDIQNLPVVMKGLPGTLHLVSVPEGARFYVNDEARGVGPLVLPGLMPGQYTVRAELDGFGTMTKTISVDNGAATREEFKLSNVMGRLEVRTCPAGAQVIFDGNVLGVTSTRGPEENFSDVFPIEGVMEGEHTLVVRKDGYSESTRHPKIRSSKTSVANVRMKRIFVPDVEIVTSRGSYRGVLVSKTQEAVVIEVSLGITRSFPVSEIRKMNFLSETK